MGPTAPPPLGSIWYGGVADHPILLHECRYKRRYRKRNFPAALRRILPVLLRSNHVGHKRGDLPRVGAHASAGDSLDAQLWEQRRRRLPAALPSKLIWYGQHIPSVCRDRPFVPAKHLLNRA